MVNKKQRGAQPGHIVTEESKQKMSKARKGRTLTEAHKEKIRATMMGHKVTDETRQRMSIETKKRWDRTKKEKEELKKMEEIESILNKIDKEIL